MNWSLEEEKNMRVVYRVVGVVKVAGNKSYIFNLH